MASVLTGTAVRIETAALPPVTVALVGDGQGGPAPWYVALLKPRVTVLYQGQVLTTLTPAGDPGPARWPWVVGLAALGAGVVLYFALKGLRA